MNLLSSLIVIFIEEVFFSFHTGLLLLSAMCKAGASGVCALGGVRGPPADGRGRTEGPADTRGRHRSPLTPAVGPDPPAGSPNTHHTHQQASRRRLLTLSTHQAHNSHTHTDIKQSIHLTRITNTHGYYVWKNKTRQSPNAADTPDISKQGSKFVLYLSVTHAPKWRPQSPTARHGSYMDLCF